MATIDMGRKLGQAVPLLGGGAGSPCNTMWPGPQPTFVQVASRFIQPLGHNRHGRNLGWLCTLASGAGSASNSVARAEAYRRTKWHLDPSSRLATTNGPKIGGCVPFLGGGGAWSPSSTMRPWRRPTSIASGILIHAAIWPQQIWA